MRITTPLMKALYAIQSLQSDLDQKMQMNFRVDPLLPDPEVTSLKLSGMGLKNDDLEKLMPPLISLNSLVSLRHLDLSENEFTRIPEAMGQLTSLQILNLENNSLESLMENTSQLTSLRELHLGQNAFKKLPASLENLKGLRVLTADRNRLTSLTEQIGNLKNLKKLQLWGNQLRELPPTIGNLKKLRSLLLGYNQLRSFPEEIAKLTQLSELRAERNLLSEVQDELAALTNLKTLELWGNLIEAITDKIDNLERLEKLSLDSNKLNTIPQSLAGMEALQILNLDGNPLEPDPGDETAQKTTENENPDKTKISDGEQGETVVTPSQKVIADTRLKIEDIINKANYPDTVASSLFDVQKQMELLERELDIISKFKDTSETAYTDKLSNHATLFCEQLEKDIKQFLSLSSGEVEVDLNLSQFIVPKNLSKSGLEKRKLFPKKSNGQRKPDEPGFKL